MPMTFKELIDVNHDKYKMCYCITNMQPPPGSWPGVVIMSAPPGEVEWQPSISPTVKTGPASAATTWTGTTPAKPTTAGTTAVTNMVITINITSFQLAMATATTTGMETYLHLYTTTNGHMAHMNATTATIRKPAKLCRS